MKYTPGCMQNNPSKNAGPAVVFDGYSLDFSNSRMEKVAAPTSVPTGVDGLPFAQ
jgi:hypothetical protein